MAGNLSFSVAINLLTEKFKSGANEFKNSMRSMQMQTMSMFAAIGAGSIGLSSFVSNLITTARETSKATTALKNISCGAEQFGKNQKFLIDLSQKYGLYVNDLVGNFAKFTAAASNANMPMQDQQNIFESLSRASVAFGLSSDETNGVFLAITQMMGKGKISAEELRGQLGERMPVAMQAMAKAAGVTVAGLDQLMKNGKLMSADVLPKFAKALDEMLPNVSTDNIESSFNRLKNTFKELSDKLNVGDIYKGLLDQTGVAAQWIMNNFKTVGNAIVNVVSTLILTKGLKMISNYFAGLSQDAYKFYFQQAKQAGESFDKAAFCANKFSLVAKFAFRSIAASFAPMLIISGLVAIGQKLYDWYSNQKRINNLYKDYQQELKNAGNGNSEVIKMQSLQRVMNNRNESQQRINSAQKELMKMLGLEHGTQKQINEAIKNRIALIKDSARAEMYGNKIAENEGKIGDLSSSVNLTTEQVQKLVRTYIKGGENDNLFLEIGREVRKTGNKGSYDASAILNIIKEVGVLNKINNDASKQLDKTVTNASKLTSTSTPTEPKTDKKNKKTDLEKVEDDYAKQLIELTNKLHNNNINQDDYNSNLYKLNKETNDKLSGLLTPAQAKANKTFNITKTTSIDDINQVERDYTKSLSELNKLKQAGIYDTDKYNDELKSLNESTIKAGVAIDGIDVAGNQFIQGLITANKKFQKAADWTVAQSNGIDHTFDYKKNDVEKQQDKVDSNKSTIDSLSDKFKSNTGKDFGEALKEAGGNLEALKSQFNGIADELIGELDSAMKKAPNLEDALKLQKVKNDVKDLKKQIASGIYSGIKDIANSSRNVVESWKNVKEVMHSPSSKGWEKFLAIFDALANTADAIISVVTLIQNLISLTGTLSAAKATQAGIEIAASKTKTAAYTAEMAAASAAAYAAIPFVGQELALAQIATLQAVIIAAGVPKFANGGIVGGSSFGGDNIIARVNSGEMILNSGQQATLFSLLNGNNSTTTTTGGSVEFKISGKDLKGVLANYDKIKGKV